MSYKILDHATDAFIEVQAPSLKDAFEKAGESLIDLTIHRNSVERKEERIISIHGIDLEHLLFNWLEEVNFLLITEGFAISQIKVKVLEKNEPFISGIATGEPIDLEKHQYKLEIKAPTFHLMEINEKNEDGVVLRFLLDL